MSLIMRDSPQTQKPETAEFRVKYLPCAQTSKIGDPQADPRSRAKVRTFIDFLTSRITRLLSRWCGPIGNVTFLGRADMPIAPQLVWARTYQALGTNRWRYLAHYGRWLGALPSEFTVCPRPGPPRSFSEICTRARCRKDAAIAPVGSSSSIFAWKESNMPVTAT